MALKTRLAGLPSDRPAPGRTCCWLNYSMYTSGCLLLHIYRYIFGFDCVLLNRFFYPSTSSTTSVRADYAINREKALWSLNCAADILHYYAVSRVDNAMPWHCTGYDRHNIHMIWKRESQRNKKATRKKTENKQRKKCRAFPWRMWQTKHKTQHTILNELKKQHHYIYKQSKTKNQGK